MSCSDLHSSESPLCALGRGGCRGGVPPGAGAAGGNAPERRSTEWQVYGMTRHWNIAKQHNASYGAYMFFNTSLP